VLGLFWKRIRMEGVFAGVIVGVVCTAFLILTNRDPFRGLNAGFIALCLNFTVTILISTLAPAKISSLAEAS
jgi:solute:Na+ symporter, SSS family